MNWHGCKPAAEQDGRLLSGSAWSARPTSTNVHAVDGCPPRPAGAGASCSAHEIALTLTGRRSAAVLPCGGPPWPLVSVSVSFTPVRHRSPVVALIVFAQARTVADAGERWPALLESVLGATPREFESRILRHADLRRRAWIMFARCATSPAC